MDNQFEFVHVGLTDVKVGFEHQVKEVVHVFKVIIVEFIAFFKLLSVVGLSVGCRVKFFVVHHKFLFLREHVQLVATKAVDVVVKVESSEPPLFIRYVIGSGVDVERADEVSFRGKPSVSYYDLVDEVLHIVSSGS